MGFSLGSIGRSVERALRPALKKAAPQLASGIGSTFGGPVGAQLAGDLASAYVSTPVPAAMPGGGPAPIALPGIVPVGYSDGVEPTVGPGVAAAGVSLVRFLLAKASSFLGRRVTKVMALDLIRKFGPTAAASALGWTAAEAVQFWMSGGATKRRRRRGLTYRQLSEARRVYRTVQSMASSIGCRRPARRAPAPARRRR